MPHKDMNERLDTYKRTASINFTKFENNTDQFIDVLVAKQTKLARTISEKEWTKKIMAKISKK